MPSEARRLHGFTVVSRALRLARQLLVPAIVGGASVGGDFAGAVLWILVILSLPSLLLATAQWIVFRFGLENDDLIIDSGVVFRRRRVIPLDRVQNVDLEQSAIERLAGVAELRIETASGGQETEASLTVLSLSDARALQADLLARRGAARRAAPTPGDSGEEVEPQPERILLRLSPLDLALAGATANEAGLIAAGLATVLELVGRIGALERAGDWIEEAFDMGVGLGFMGAIGILALVALVFLVLGWVVSIVASMVRFHGFTLTRVGDDLKREYGLLSRHHTTVPLERVQAVRVEETLLRRAFGLVAIKVETAGAVAQNQGGGAETYVPIARRAQVGRLLREVFEDATFDGVPLQSVAPASRRRELVRIEIGVLLAAAGLAVLMGYHFLAVLILLVPGWFLARARYRARGWARADGYVLARAGVLTRTTWVVPERKIQTLHVSETPFQRRLNLATLLVDTAGGGRDARVVDLHTATARQLLARLAHDADIQRIKAVRAAG